MLILLNHISAYVFHTFRAALFPFAFIIISVLQRAVSISFFKFSALIFTGIGNLECKQSYLFLLTPTFRNNNLENKP